MGSPFATARLAITPSRVALMLVVGIAALLVNSCRLIDDTASLRDELVSTNADRGLPTIVSLPYNEYHPEHPDFDWASVPVAKRVAEPITTMPTYISAEREGGQFDEIRAVQHAKTHAPTVLLAGVAQRGAYADLIGARAALRPRVSFEASLGEQPDRLPSNTAVVDDDFGFGVYVRQQLFDWGASKRRIQSAYQREMVTQLEKEASITTTIGEVRQGFARLRQIARRRQIYATFGTRVNELAKDVEAGIEAGEESRTALLGLQTRLRSAESEGTILEAERARVERAILLLIGAAPGSSISVGAGSNGGGSLGVGEPALVSEALRERPEIQAAGLLLSAARGDAGAVKVEGRPRLDLTLGATASAPLNGLDDDWRDDFGVGVVGTWVPIDGGVRKSELMHAEANIESAAITLEQTQNLIEFEVSGLYQEVEAGKRTLSTVAQERAAAKESRALVVESYRSGIDPVYRVISRISSELDAEIKYVDAQYQVESSRAQLSAAAGRL